MSSEAVDTISGVSACGDKPHRRMAFSSSFAELITVLPMVPEVAMITCKER